MDFDEEKLRQQWAEEDRYNINYTWGNKPEDPNAEDKYKEYREHDEQNPPTGEDVYCTLLLNDGYLPGAQVLAHSLRDVGTTKKLAVIFRRDRVSKETVEELKKVYDYVEPVEPIISEDHAGLGSMDRPDLAPTLTKIRLWQLKFRRIVYLDADTVVLRSPDALFDIEPPARGIVAIPEGDGTISFNSGVMVLTPRLLDFKLLEEKALRVAAGDRLQAYEGADQGLLNKYFQPRDRPSNVRITNHGFNIRSRIANNTYQYTVGNANSAAFDYYHHGGHSVRIAHFAGPDKPWFRPQGVSLEPHDQWTRHWWSVWNRHYSAYGTGGGPARDITQGGESYDYASALGGSAGAQDGGVGSSSAPGDSGAQDAETSPSQTERKSSADVSKLAQDIGQVEELAAETPIQKAPASPPVASPSTPPLTHHERYLRNLHRGTVITPEGTVPQEDFYQTASRSYYIQRYDANGNPIPRSPSSTPPHSAKELLEQLNAKMNQNQDQNPQREPIPSASAVSPPAVALSSQLSHLRRPSILDLPNFANADMDSNSNSGTPGYNVDWNDNSRIEPAPKPIFPWEERQRTVTRVFADIIPPASYQSDPEDDDEENDDGENSDAGSDNTEGWNNQSFRNKWDGDSNIQNYVTNLQQRTKRRAPDGVNVTPGSSSERA